MSEADRVRQYVFDRHIFPARGAGQGEITVRAGDVHREMGLVGAMPTVCSALGGKKFTELSGTSLIERSGPPAGSNVYFRFGLEARPDSTKDRPKPIPPITRHETPPRPVSKRHVDLSGALVLVSCVKSKLPHPAPARDLYTSALFVKMRSVIEAGDAPWFILSALHGLVPPYQAVPPYEYTLNTASIDERRTWAAKVLEQLRPHLKGRARIVMFAGSRYREFLEGPLRDMGLTVEVPMEGLTLGRQLSWLSGPA
jgi:hypothetical protein